MTNIILGISVLVAVYCVLALALNVPSFSISSRVNAVRKLGVKRNTLIDFLSTLSKPFAKYVPLSLAKEIKLNKLLIGAHSTENAQEFIARLVLVFLIVGLIGSPLMLISVWLITPSLLFATLMVIGQYNDIANKSEERQLLLQLETPRLVENVSHNLKTNRNIINIFDSYVHNYDSYLSRELAKTIIDMRTGSQEVALQRFEMRMNNPMISQFIRGILATMRGEDMTQFFGDLVLKLAEIRKQQLKAQALKVKPKISIMSAIRAIWSLLILLIMLGSGALQLVSNLGGL